MIWTDALIKKSIEYSLATAQRVTARARTTTEMQRMRNDYEARIAEIEHERDEYKDVASANAAVNRQCKERIADLETEVDRERNYTALPPKYKKAE